MSRYVVRSIFSVNDSHCFSFFRRIYPCVWLESGASRVRANLFPWLFGWRMRGLGWLQGGIFLSDAGWLRPLKSGGRSRSSRVGSFNPCFHSTSFNQILNGLVPSPKSEVQPNTGRVGSVPKNWVGSNPTHPTPNQTHDTIVNTA
jgi:hypothetical protein